MPTRHWDRSFRESSQGRIIGLLRQGSRTIEELSTALGLTGNAVRSHITTLERNGFVIAAEQRRTSRKPAQVYRSDPRQSSGSPRLTRRCWRDCCRRWPARWTLPSSEG